MGIVHRFSIRTSIRRWGAAAGLLSVLSFLPSQASANWYLHQIVNHSPAPLTVLIPINPGETRSSQNILVRGNIALDLAGNGIIKFTDIGHFDHPCSMYWSVAINYGTQAWTYSYDGDGRLGATIAADGSLTLQAINGRVVPGNRASPC